jgi:hypothetical protein
MASVDTGDVGCCISRVWILKIASVIHPGLMTEDLCILLISYRNTWSHQEAILFKSIVHG